MPLPAAEGTAAVAGRPDPRPVKTRREHPSSGGRRRDRHASLKKRLRERSCRLSLPGCMGVAHSGHHLVPKGAPHFGDDVPENIIPTCGSGTTGCHGRIENGDVQARATLARTLRLDEWSYVVSKMGGKQAAIEWLSRTHFVSRGKLRDLYD